MTEVKYLVRNLTLITKGEETNLSLYYIEYDSEGSKINYFPFDRERPGFEYRDYLTLVFSEGHWIELLKS